ncbi:DUF2974 domain-containing protein [Streptococcus sanguinis]|uniref:DUF2974 domain-containing protein n=1 Tax=Streptococcus sanguinis TaxID=1305 RepID=UPI0003D34DB2|nr:hypothetical protein HMPREF1196_01532 [Streptococcus sanguinis CC94A]
MSNSNLKSFDNFYADLAQSSYHGRPVVFPYESLTKDQRKKLDSGDSILFDFSKNKKYKQTEKDPVTGAEVEVEREVIGGGKDLDHEGRVYLHPDPDLHTVEETTTLKLPNPNGGYHEETYITNSYQKGLMTDEKAGFNSYFLTDSEELGSKTTKAYMAIRGSDGMRLETWNDWVDNDANFAFNHSRIPQAKLATVAMRERIKEIKEKAPDNVKMDVAAHSLGTMVSVQGLAGLSVEELKTIGQVVLLDGPDTRKSLKNMNVSKEVYDELNARITYYLNPFDIVSMLNRENTIYNLENPNQEPLEKPLGTAHVVVPLHYTAFFKMDESSHDFGVMQMDTSGNYLVASKDFHPELLKAGEKLARLEQKFLNSLRSKGYSDNVALTVMTKLTQMIVSPTMTALESSELAMESRQFVEEYGRIISEARKESIEWDKKAIADYKNQLSNSKLTGEKRIELQTKLLQTAAQLASFGVEDCDMRVGKLLDDTKEKLQTTVSQATETAYSMATHLSHSEVDQMLSDFTIDNFWDEAVYTDTKAESTNFRNSIDQLSVTLVRGASLLNKVDSQSAESFNALLEETKNVWRTPW